MSARKRVRGNVAVHCDMPGCPDVQVADSWTTDVVQLRAWMRGFTSWRRCYRYEGPRQRKVQYDVCPSKDHAPHYPDCSCPKCVCPTCTARRKDEEAARAARNA